MTAFLLLWREALLDALTLAEQVGLLAGEDITSMPVAHRTPGRKPHQGAPAGIEWRVTPWFISQRSCSGTS